MTNIKSEPLDVLHVASFVGNIGDNANHNGTRAQLESNLRVDLRFEETEIRKYYQNYSKEDSLSFDDNFIEAANDMDLVLIGGGSFFDIWIDDSSTGTTINLSPDQMNRISTPIVFHGLGSIPRQGTSKELVERFRKFLDYILNSDHTLVSVRNDGSANNIADIVGESYGERITTIPDGAFFVNVDSTNHPEVPEDGVVIGINVVSDMRDRRFPGENNTLSYDEFVEEFAEFANTILETHPDYHLLFIPHIYSDIAAIADILSELDIMYRRNRVTTAPYLHGMGSERYMFDVYASVDVSMGLRLHSNVCPIGLGTPSIGLENGHPKVADLYAELGYPERTIPVHRSGFPEELINIVEDTLENNQEIKKGYKAKKKSLKREINEFHEVIGDLINRNN